VISVNEINTGNFSIGAGFSSVDSILGFVEVTQGNFDLFHPPWFQGGGQKLRLRAQFGAKREDYELTFIEPWLFGRKLQFSTDLYHRDLRFVSLNDLYNQRRTGARFGLSRALGSDYLIGGVSYTIESDSIYDVSTNASPAIQAEAGTRLVSKVGASLAYDTRNNSLMPTKGQRTELRGEIAGGPLGGDTDFYKFELGSAWYFKGFGQGHILEVGGRAGIVDNYGNTTSVPLFDRWFLGGIDSLRGYRYRQVGPVDFTGEPLGGGTYWFGSVEYSIPIVEFLRFAVFYDVGMVYPDAYQWDFGHYNDNWGLGIRLNIPRLGPIALDYGIPITSDPNNTSHGRFQFRVGYSREF
jgi:outer membrane protein insertion porin family